MVDGRKTYDKSGRQRRGAGILSQTGIGMREESVPRRDLWVGDGGNFLVGLARVSCRLAVRSHYSMFECVHFKKTGHLASYPKGEPWKRET
jgi:hypothetical protein